jgi:hypothetical protein
MKLNACRSLLDKLRANIQSGRERSSLMMPFFCAVILGVLAFIAAGDFFISHSGRRTITFYAEVAGSERVEERFISWTFNREEAVRAYIVEVLLGPSFPGSAPLFSGETRLEACFLRDGIVTVGFSVEAALPVSSSGFDVLDRLKGMRRDLKRNFYFVRDVRFFIAGEELALPQENGS